MTTETQQTPQGKASETAEVIAKKLRHLAGFAVTSLMRETMLRAAALLEEKK